MHSGGSFSRVWASILSLFAALLAHSSHFFHYYSHARIRRQQNKEKNTNTMINKSNVETHAFLISCLCSARFLSRLLAAKEKRLYSDLYIDGTYIYTGIHVKR